jgi:hypothetical protein
VCSPNDADKHRKRNIPVEEIVIDSSDSLEDEGDLSFVRQSNATRLYKVVTPPIFRSSGSQALKQYFQTYERYFQIKYSGSQKECSMDLSKFLDGEALKAYHYFNGAEKRYPILKELLLDWYRSHQVQGSKRWRSELKKMRMTEGDSFKLFGMKIVEVAKKAYPRNERECAKKMQEQFIHVMPDWFKEKLHQQQDMKEMIGQGNKLNWSDMMRQAEKEDKNKKEKNWKKEPLMKTELPVV